MDKTFAINHVNEDHLDALIAIYQKHIGEAYKTIKLHDYDLENLDILIDEHKHILIPFPTKLNSLQDFKNTFIEMFKNASAGFDLKQVEKDLKDFLDQGNSVILGTLLDGEPGLSSALLIRSNHKFYIYISEVADHYQALKQNPDKLKVMWLQSEEAAARPIARVKATFKARAKFIDSLEQKHKIFASVAHKIGSHGGVSQIGKMQDFHLVELILDSGRFVKGFGQAYDVNSDLTIKEHLRGNPHRYEKQ
ncbi:DUF2470 domain-containing protein [[Mycoplasma] testudinis]|uniref:DUF2470 domain-containing protein n=1 Tax=[Mycoplasma] testudinis TaxID=33924 RepID=UPI00048649D2|nr:DUF2470 domain-containing protein [[Mycoplasma] testudinis]